MRYARVAAALTVSSVAAVLHAQDIAPLRAPAVPLVTHDPYFSVWSFSDKLTDSWPRHWTGKTMGMCGLARIDGKAYRWCGPEPRDVPAMEQVSCEVGPMSTAYRFHAGNLELNVIFRSPAIPTDTKVASVPATFIECWARSLVGHPCNDTRLYLDCSAEWCVNTPDQMVRWSRARSGGLDLLTFSSQDQAVLQKKGAIR